MLRTPAYRNMSVRWWHRASVIGSTIAGAGLNAPPACVAATRMVAMNGGSASSSHARGAADYYNQAKEDEEDKVLEDEEFAALRDGEVDEYMPVTHRLAGKADALDAELRRLRYVLCDQPQFLVDTAAATVSGRPTQMKRVLEMLAGKECETGSSAGTAGGPSARSGGSRVSSLTPKVAAALRASPYSSWTGTSAPLTRLLSRGVLWRRTTAAASEHGTELATMDANLDYLRRGRALHQLNYYSRLNLIPKRHIWLGLYQMLWNFLIAAQNACGCVVYGTLRGVKENGLVKGGCTGAASGCVKALAFLGYGFVLSPGIHVIRGLCNTLYGPVNALTGHYMFDAISGRWMRCTVADTQLFRHELQREKRVLRAIGRAEFRRKRMKVESKWAKRMADMGFSVEMIADKMRGGRGGGNSGSGAAGKAEEKMKNPYEVLQVRRTASAQDIKKQYKKLAMVFHPDVVQSRQGGSLSKEEKATAQRKFEEIASAYQVLSNPEKRKAYDMGGAQGVHLHETKYGKFMSRTPEEMVQSIFGGEGFRRLLVGELLRSHWALRYEAQVSVSLHELESLQCIRVRQMALELAAIADVHARRPTTPYHGNANATQAAPRHASAPHGSSSSLPDYLKSGKPKVRGAAAATTTAAGGQSGRHASGNGAASATRKGVEKEMHDTIMEELGGSRVSSAAGAAAAGLGARKGADASGSATTAAASPSALSPYVLRPGSNEYNCFSRDFEERCDRLVRHLADACFGKQLLYEVGLAYVVHAQRFLGIRPFYASKALVTRKIFSGMDRVVDAFKDKTRLNKEQVAHKMVAEYFNMEYDSIVADMHVALRYAVQVVLQDAVETAEVRQKRCYAVWLLGEKMMAAGERWTSRIAKDEDLAAYIQQAASAAATTGKPPVF